MVNLPTRKCKTCVEEKVITEYYVHSYRNKDRNKPVYSVYCKTCYNRRSKDRKQKVIDSVFAKIYCQRCGYDTHPNAIDFHHREADQKDFSIASAWSLSEERLKRELNKCTMLCANCHRELHAGVWSL